jgi:hypothetical protein
LKVIAIPADGYVEDGFVWLKFLKKFQGKYGKEKLARLWDCFSFFTMHRKTFKNEDLPC